MTTAPGPKSWAVKYGALANGRFGSDKSGFTPIEYVFPTLGQTSNPNVQAIEDFQRKNLYGFTSRELGQLDCLPMRELAPGNLQNDIIPILQRENWETAPAQPDFTRNHMYPLQNGKGMWSADNDEVWNVVEPIVQLASRMLMSVHVMPWFDALLNGERRPIPDHRLHPADKKETGLESFHKHEFTQEGLDQQRDSVFETLRTKFGLKYGFMIGSESPQGPEKPAEDALGITVTNTDYMQFDPSPNKSWRVYVFINVSQPGLLMRDGLNTAERMTIQWAVANTIVHETMHAVAALYLDLHNRADKGEPYFEDQALAEVGFSFEAIVNSGIPQEFLYDPNPPLGYFLRRYWPTYYDVWARDLATPILTAPDPLTYNEHFPIPISFYQDIQQENFWSVIVRQFGNTVFHYRALKEGSRVNYTVTDVARGTYKRCDPVRFTEGDPFKILNGQFKYSVKGLKAAINLTPEEREAMKFGQTLVTSSELQEVFWNDTVAQKTSIQNIANTIASAVQAGNTPDHIRQVYLAIFNFTEEAITKHERMIAGTISQENVNDVIYTDRREKLFAWNKGTRSFIRQLIQADTQRNLNLEAEELRMEQCRMALWNPNDESTRSGNDGLEITILQNARQALRDNRPDECRAICNRLLREDWRSIFAECAVRAILFTLDKDVSDRWRDRLADLQKVKSVLENLKAAAPVYWIDEVLALQTEVEDLLTSRDPATPMQLVSPEQGPTVGQNPQQGTNMGSPIPYPPTVPVDGEEMEE